MPANNELPLPTPRHQMETLSSAQFLPQVEQPVPAATVEPAVEASVASAPNAAEQVERNDPWSPAAVAAEKARYDATAIGKLFAKLGDRTDAFYDRLGFRFIGFNTDKKPDDKW